MKNYKEREKEFLKELTDLTLKYKICISGCGCCGSPALDDISDENKIEAKVLDSSESFGYRLVYAYPEHIEYQYEEHLEFNKLKNS